MNFLITDACFLDSIITDHIKIDSARELSNEKMTLICRTDKIVLFVVYSKARK